MQVKVCDPGMRQETEGKRKAWEVIEQDENSFQSTGFVVCCLALIVSNFQQSCLTPATSYSNLDDRGQAVSSVLGNE